MPLVVTYVSEFIPPIQKNQFNNAVTPKRIINPTISSGLNAIVPFQLLILVYIFVN